MRVTSILWRTSRGGIRVGVGDRARVTIADIAAEAGVSVPTVSRVLNGRTDVAATTRVRVAHLLQLRDYQRRGGGRTPHANLIELVFDDLDSPWAFEIVRGVDEVAHERGVGTVISAIHKQPASEQLWWQNVQSRASDGIILVTSRMHPKLQAEVHRFLPTVIIDPYGLPSHDVPTIGATNWAGGLSAVEHLVGLGHRRIAIVTGCPPFQCSRARLDGYRGGLEAAGLPVDPDLIYAGDFSHESGFAGATKFLGLSDPPTAVFASCDPMAFGVYAKPRASTACGCRSTSASSVSTTCQRRCGPRRRSRRCGSRSRRWAFLPPGLCCDWSAVSTSTRSGSSWRLN